MGRLTEKTEPWQRYLVGELAAVVFYFALPGGGLAQGYVFVGIHLSALVAIVVGIRRHRPRFAAAWWVIAVGEAVYAVANVLWYLYTLTFDVELPYPSAADALYVPAYVTVLIGIAMLMWRRSGGDRTSLIDAAIVMVGVGGPSWVFLMRPYVDDPTSSALFTLFSIAYPLIDLLLLGVMMLIAFRPRARSAAYALLCLGVVPNLVADTSLTVTTLAGNFSFGAPFFAGWMVFYVLLGTTALHPSMRELSEPVVETERVLTRPRLFFLATSALIPPLAILVEESIRPEGDRTLLALLCTVLFALVLVRVSGLMSDITEHKRMEKTKDEFISVVSHELRTPHTSIRGALGLLASGAMGELPPKSQRMLEIASSNTDRLVRLINDILDIERMESGQETLQRQDCDAADLVGQAVDAMRAMADEAGVRLSASARPVSLFADPDRVLQTLINLTNNAVKFSPPQGTVTVGSERRDGEVLFTVSDQGRGIPADKLELIFGRFQQVDASDARQKGGTGLGLAICRSIVTQHGGRIWAESTPGKGSTFSFTLPALPERQESEPDHDVGADQGPSVLVCDDDPEVLEVVGAMLAGRGYAVIPVTTGRRAVEVARTRRPAAILLDLIMPGVSGWDTIAALKQDRRTADIPLIALTVLAEDHDPLGQAGVDDWITKPIHEPALFAALKRALSGDAATTTVLVVEDDLDLAQVLTAMFEHHGLIAFHAQTVQQAVAMSCRVLPDLLVLDLMLPDGDGAEIVDFFREDDRLRDTPLVVYTAKDLDEAERAGLKLGHTEIFTKGRITPAEFERRVATLLDRVVSSKAKVEAQA